MDFIEMLNWPKNCTGQNFDFSNESAFKSTGMFINNENLPEAPCHQSAIYLVIFPHNLKVLSTIIKASSSPRPSLKLIPASHKSKQNKLELNFSMLFSFCISNNRSLENGRLTSHIVFCVYVFIRGYVYSGKRKQMIVPPTRTYSRSQYVRQVLIDDVNFTDWQSC